METICLGKKIAANLKLTFLFYLQFFIFLNSTNPDKYFDKPDTRTGRIN